MYDILCNIISRILGGPGSNKAALCTQAVRNMPGWLHISIGELLRTMASSNMIVNDAIVSGEMVPHNIIMQLVEQQILLNRDSDGIVMDGYPRDLNQVQEFETKVNKIVCVVLYFKIVNFNLINNLID